MLGEAVDGEVRAFVRWLETVVDVQHEITLDFAPHIYGLFSAPNAYEMRGPYIDISVGDGKHLLDTIAHEIVHYEQWRDRRKITERGVEKRANALVKKWKEGGE